ncbi:MAG: hypothetical protein GY948_00280 [Alphaproteobacteria bacterium]|nr:hypothetical protein [Alphaproteobacteria bacterium]
MRIAALILAAAIAAPTAAGATFAANDLSCTVYTPAKPGLLATCDGPFKGPGETISIELHGSAPNQVQTIRLKFADGALPTQDIALKAEPVIDLETVGVLFMDFNFDGLEDLGVMEFLPAGANVPYKFYLFDPAQGKFVENAALSALTSPEVQTKKKQISSHWQDGAARSGHDLYEWIKGTLTLVSRVEQNYSDSGCQAKTYQNEAGKLMLKSEGVCK